MKTSKRRQQKAALLQKRQIEEKIPYKAVYDLGIVKTKEGTFSKAYRIEDTTYDDIKNIGMDTISTRFDELIREVSKNFSMQFLIHNSLVSKKAFLEKIKLPKCRKEPVDEQIELYNGMVEENSWIGHNNVKKNKYFVISVSADTANEARDAFLEYEDGIKELFKRICNIEIMALSSMELLEILYGIYNPSPDHGRARRTIKDEGFSSLEAIRKKKKTTKELIMPDSMDLLDVDTLILNGNTYVRSFYITTIPQKVSANLISDITNISSNMIFSCIFEPLDTDVLRSILSKHVEDNTKITRSLIRDTITDRKLKRVRRQEEMITAREEEYFYKAALDDLEDDEVSMMATFVVTLFAGDADELERDTQLLHISTSKFACLVKPVDLEQTKGLSSALPLCVDLVDCKRKFSSRKLSMMPPLCLSEILLKDGIFCGLNSINDNLILLNRKNNPTLAGLISGTEHSGKTFQCKREALNALMSTGDDVFIISETDEYDGFVKKLGGDICSNIFTNPLLIPEGYGMGSDKYSKCLFLEALCALVLEKEEDTAAEVSKFYDELVLMGERSSSSIYMYIAANQEEYPVLSKVARLLFDYEQEHMFLLNSPARLKLIKVKSALEKTMILENLFAVRKKKCIWIFADSVDEFFLSDTASGFFKDYIDKLNHSGHIFTGVVQSSIKLFSENAGTYRLTDMVNSFGYHKLLNQGAKEREIYTQILNIPTPLVNYITTAELGKGIILTPASSVAFDDNFLSDEESGYSNRFYEIFKE
ncbi:MAG: hypothetical protein IKN95_07810 [Lachnospiraceae bacterium]|nr:hypothetical protein [Lachnospiraceae bacterium]